MNTIKSYFQFSKEQRNGIFVLLLIIVALQAIWFYLGFNTIITTQSKEELEWLAKQSEIDSLKDASVNKKFELRPFNPNFISDYKGYKLGMSVQEIDRLVAFRKTNQYVNSAQEFQEVTKISDSLLKAISPYFKFPDWVTNKKESKVYVKYEKQSFSKTEKIHVLDVNTASQEDFMKLNGIGVGYSERIIKFRESLGGFVSMEQLDDVWGLPPEVITKLNASFKIASQPVIKKLDINNASVKEIAQFPYFRYALAKEIVTFRSMNGDFKNATDLTKIKGLSIDKANIIALYLTF
ncbi:helix-hairpin-helix domain-containing protein [Flavobacterium algicola]|uniref:helix-hairpin-helix domain-containing protein n=1 Tax=Flavobacterium algicola TaxID=556529 RepID=UPI001EFDC136|nr:helix-hairpin-helix domain-containing protein [Flavobacterium algicola]MCG9791237.1 helix-hairpin-helix domain-containing protein [Flavobacterium algicola]